MSENTETILELRGITKSFGGTEVLRGISLAIRRGEFITFLGSSGCGKTTTLRIIAGLESPDSGVVLLGGSDVTNVEPNKRDVNTIFQNYALFPHMDVFHNIAYSLKLRHVARDEIQRRVTEMLTLVQLEGYEKRMPSELSGGQKQRVAIARAVINNPSVLLLDEPLGALDLQLRRQMQAELKRLQKQLGITFLYITHDQEEAINMSDRIVVMNEGQFEQIGSPSEIYDNPRTSFVAGFVGTANLLTGIVKQVDANTASVSFAGGTVLTALPEGGLRAGEAVTLCVRSENVLVSRTPREGFCLPARVVESSYSGGMLRTVFSCGDTELIATRHGIHAVAEPGGEAFLSWEPENSVPVDRGADDAQG